MSVLNRYHRAGLSLPSGHLLEPVDDKLYRKGAIAGSGDVWVHPTWRNSKQILFGHLTSFSFYANMCSLCISTDASLFLMDTSNDHKVRLMEAGVTVNGRKFKVECYCFFGNNMEFGRITKFVCIDVSAPDLTIVCLDLFRVLSKAPGCNYVYIVSPVSIGSCCIFAKDIVSLGVMATHWHRRDYRCALVVDPPMRTSMHL